MMPIETIEFLISSRQKDAKVLLKQKRNFASTYLIGYAIELALKRRICNSFLFINGFPEHNYELAQYGNFPFRINEIKTHDLNKLLFYSGREALIKSNYLTEWQTVSSWNSESRYKKIIMNTTSARNFLKASVIIINAIS